ncbi:hypothetical protein SCP_0402170 [Sparassis crispa]|uniref:Uncharacterized protein n=1 Tax=Sparassis crispa TaxID=139825 RepID=A0A401GI87_9APHY|nr:hypothetical protein SCP_0402170 [Sparassis crispa]GBE81843.1 hypothetical protein SCP_0402170 [Sparassis crispa]
MPPQSRDKYTHSALPPSSTHDTFSAGVTALYHVKHVAHQGFRHDDGYDSRHTTSHSFVGWAPWIGICLAIWTMALIIAEVIPFFNDLLGVIGSMFARWFIYGITGVLWFH